MRTYAGGGWVNEKLTGAYKGGGGGGPKLAILLRTYFMDAPKMKRTYVTNNLQLRQKQLNFFFYGQSGNYFGLIGHSVHPHPFCWGVGGVNLLPNFQKVGGGLDRTSTLREGLLEKRG